VNDALEKVHMYTFLRADGNISQSKTLQSMNDEARPKEVTEELNLGWICTYKAVHIGCQIAKARSAPCARRKRFRAEPSIKRRLERPQRTEGEDQAQHGECPADGRVEQREGTHDSSDVEEEQRDVEQPRNADLEHPGNRVSLHALVPLHPRDHALAGCCTGRWLAVLVARDPTQGHV
jgi:hypothetical protein